MIILCSRCYTLDILQGMSVTRVLFLWFLQGAQQSSEAVSRVSGGAGGAAGVGQRRAATADQQPGHQLLLRLVSRNT